MDTGHEYFFGPDEIPKGLSLLSQADTLFGHNFQGFDLRAIKKVCGWVPSPKTRVIDTLVWSRLVHSDLKNEDLSGRKAVRDLNGSHSLESWGVRLGEEKIAFEDFTKFSEEMGVYCQQDVRTNCKLVEHLLAEHVSDAALELEMRFAKLADWMEEEGFCFDVEAAGRLCDELEAQALKTQGQIRSVFPGVSETLKTPAYWVVKWADQSEEQFPTKGEADRVRKERKVKPKECSITAGPMRTRLHEFNPNSRPQIRKALFEKYAWVSTKLTPKGQELLQKGGVFEEIAKDYGSVSEDILRPLHFEETERLADYLMVRKLMGMVRDGENGYLRLEKNGRIHHRMNPCGCATMRVSHCIEENQRVKIPRGDIPIKDVRIGDWVYSYTQDHQLRMNRVLDVIPKGVADVRRYYFKSMGKLIALEMTPNHKVWTEEGYVEAGHLRKGQRCPHLHTSIVDNRKTLSWYNRGKKRQCTFIKEHVLGGPAGHEWHAHHKDENTLNDDVDNLELIHCTRHRVEKHPRGLQLDVTPWQLLRMLAKTKGIIREVPMDFDTYKKYCVHYGIDIHTLSKRYRKNGQGRTGQRRYITKGEIYRAWASSGGVAYRFGQALGMDQRSAFRIAAAHGICLNHTFSHSEPVGLRTVYDLHVERDNNFICEEICVSNSSPNLGQVPHVLISKETKQPLRGIEGRFGYEMRSLFIASPGRVLVGTDLSGIEARMLAHFLAPYDGGNYIKLVLDGDVHQLNVDSIREFAGFTISRTDSKTGYYGVLYGIGALKQGRQACEWCVEAAEEKKRLTGYYTRNPDKITRTHRFGKLKVPYRPEEMAYAVVGSKLSKAISDGIDGYGELSDRVKEASKRGYLTPLDGRRIPVRKEHSALNTLLQGGAAIVMKRWAAETFRECDLLGIDSVPLVIPHDEIQADCLEPHVEAYQQVCLGNIARAGEHFNLAIPLSGESKVGHSWSDTH